MEVKESEDEALERYLQRSGPLSRAYLELGDERPAASLDQAVISEARAAIAERRQSRRSQWHWAGITAVAATVLLSFALVMRVALEPQPVAPVPMADKQRANDGPSASALARGSGELAAPASNAPAEAPALDTGLEAPSAKKEDTVRSTNEQDEGLSRAPRRLKAAGARHELPSADRVIAEPVSTLDEMKSPDAASTAPASTAPASPPVAALPADNTAGPPAPPASNKALQKAGVKPPEEWLDEIASLRANGDEEAAEREYAEFRKAYPDYVPGTVTTPNR
jgi:hypothetical protein